MKTNEILKELRKSNNMSQEKLAEELSKYGIKADKYMVSKWERGIYSPSTDTGKAYSKVFNVSYDYLLGLTNSSTIETKEIGEVDISMLSEAQKQKLEMILTTNLAMFFNGSKNIDEETAEELRQSITEVYIHHLKETGQL